MSMRVSYSAGDMFLIPLTSGGFGRGLVGQMDGRGALVGFFFGPRLSTPEEALLTARRGDAVLVKMCGDLGLMGGTWQPLGRVEDWNEEEWNVAAFAHEQNLFHHGIRYIRRTYDATNLSVQTGADQTITEEEARTLPPDGLAGAGWIENRLDRLLA